jgi:formate dehydrogenase major subunit
MTNTIRGILDADLIFVTGSNTTEAHPVIGAKIRQAHKRGAKIIVADPRRIELVDNAELFLQIKPGTNIALYNAMLHVIIEEGLQAEDYIKERTENFDSIKELVKEYTPEKAAEICGVNADDIRTAARMYAKADKAGIFYSMGVTQFVTGTQGVTSISNLALAAGKLGIDSAGVNPLRGQNNVQGACDMGGLPVVFSGYQKVNDPVINKKFADAWGVETLSSKPGLTLTEMFSHFGEGIKLLYIMGENPLIADADVNHCKEQIKKLDFFIVQDIFLTETAELADIVLPAASFAEKDGTFVNTERRVQRVRKAVNPPGSAKPDWEIILEISRRLGYDNKYTSPREIMEEISALTPSYGGINYDRLEDIEGLHWPCPNKDHPGTPVLHKGQFTRPGGKATFAEARYTPPNETPDEDYPLILTTGRMLYQFHTRSMSGKVDGLNRKAGRSIIEINPIDAEKLGISNGEKVKASSRRGEILTTAVVTDIVAEGVVFMPFHFADGPANALTNPVYDSISKVPELKVCACRVEKL